MSPTAPRQDDDRFLDRTRDALVGPPGTYAGAPFTIAVIAINVIVFVAQIYVSGDLSALAAVSGASLLHMGANFSSYTIGDGHWYALVTATFLHGSLLHIGFNMAALRSIGPLVERSVGSGRYALMYVAAGIVGSLTSAGLAWIRLLNVPSVGASGAICGVIGAAMILGARTQGWRGPITQATARWLGMIFLLGLLPRIDNAAHVGGAITGALVAATWRRGVRHGAIARAVMVAVACGICASSAVAAYAQYRADPEHASEATSWYGRTTTALARNDCPEAVRGFIAAFDLAPQTFDVQQLFAQVESRCGAVLEPKLAPNAIGKQPASR